MALQTTKLESELSRLEQKAEEYDTRSNTETRVDQAKEDLKKLNRELTKLDRSVERFERQTGMLTEVFGRSPPPKVASVRGEVRSITGVSRDDVLDMIDDTTQSVSGHIEDVEETRDSVKNAKRIVNDRLKEIRRRKREDADTAESIQKIVGEDLGAMKTIVNYRDFLDSILDPKESVPSLKSEWQGIEKAYETLDTGWDRFQSRHGLSDQTIGELKTLSEEGEVDLDSLSETIITEMMEVPELRSTVKVSL